MIPVIQEQFITLRAASGLDIPYIGYNETVIVVHGRTENDHGILIVKDVTYIGTNWYAHYFTMSLHVFFDIPFNNRIETKAKVEEVRGFARIP